MQLGGSLEYMSTSCPPFWCYSFSHRSQTIPIALGIQHLMKSYSFLLLTQQNHHTPSHTWISQYNQYVMTGRKEILYQGVWR